MSANAQIRTMAEDFAKDINQRLDPHPQCVQLYLKNVISVSQVGDVKEQRYRFTIEVTSKSFRF